MRVEDPDIYEGLLQPSPPPPPPHKPFAAMSSLAPSVVMAVRLVMTSEEIA